MSALPAQTERRDEPAALLWEPHFSDPAGALARVRDVLNNPDAFDERTLAWAELTEGFHRLFFTGAPADASEWLERAGARFLMLGDRRGAMLADAGRARMLVYDRQSDKARQILESLYPDAKRELPQQDLFWVINALCATYYQTDNLDEAIRYLYEALELLRGTQASPHLATVLSNLAAALVTVGDYAPARELAQEAIEMLATYNNPQLKLYARSNLAEALLGTGEREGALLVVEAMLADRNPARLSPQNHYCAIAAEVLALHGRIDEARECAGLAAEIHSSSPVGFNEVLLRWAEACVHRAQDPGAGALPALCAAADSASKHKHLPTQCKAHAALAERYAALGRYEEAYSEHRKLFEANEQRLLNRASTRYYLLRVEHELTNARAERDREQQKRQESEALNRQLAELNAELSRKMREVEELQARLAREAVHDPLTQLFNRRYLDSTMPGLIGAAERRGTPLTIALVDLDYFKRVNDCHGHLAGDKVLRRIGKLFAGSLRPSDIVARWGGEEFCIVFPDTDVSGAATALASLAAKLRALEVEWAGATIGGFTYSAALAAYGANGRTLADLVSAADHALYAAKGAGRDRVLIAQNAG